MSCKGESVADLIRASNAFKAKKVLHCPSVRLVLKTTASASEAFNNVAENNSNVIRILGQEFESRLVSWIRLGHVSHF